MNDTERSGRKMKTISLTNVNLFEIRAASEDREKCEENKRYGCDQNWYGTEWQRRAGCGPSTASNLLFYMSGGQAAGSGGENPGRATREDFLALMEDVWAYVTPTDRGIPTTALFCESFLRYAADKGIEVLRHGVLDMFDEPRGTLGEAVAFIEGALVADLPVAFLNLCNGGEENLDRWHWVTIVSLEYGSEGEGEEKREKACITVLDNGELKKADLALWRRTTTLGGGFAYFYFRQGRQGRGPWTR
jgi:hypothetical protein